MSSSSRLPVALVVAATLLVVGSLVPGIPRPAEAAAESFVSLVPGRLLDSRPGESTVDGVDAGGGLRGAGSVTIAVAGYSVNAAGNQDLALWRVIG